MANDPQDGMIPLPAVLQGEVFSLEDRPEMAYPTWGAVFLETYRRTLNIRMACTNAHISRATYTRHLRGVPPGAKDGSHPARPNETWIADLEDAKQDAIDILRAKAFERASTGASDVMLKFLLEHYDTPTFGRRTMLTGPDGGPIQVATIEVQRERLFRRLAALALEGGPGPTDPPASG